MLLFIAILDTFKLLLKTLSTNSGFWNPLVWCSVIVIAFLIVYSIRSFGNKEYKKDNEQVKTFLSGNPEYEKEQMHVKSSNVYWGFTETLKWVYNLLNKMHTGNVSDYVLWFVVTMAIFFILIGVMI